MTIGKLGYLPTKTAVVVAKFRFSDKTVNIPEFTIIDGNTIHKASYPYNI